MQYSIDLLPIDFAPAKRLQIFFVNRWQCALETRPINLTLTIPLLPYRQ